jgi:hypothetical protein
VKIALDQELIVASGREALVRYSLEAGKSAVRLFLPVSGRLACRQGRGTLRALYITGASTDIADGVGEYL